MTEQAPFLIIINFIPPYDEEIAALLGGFEGVRVRFRYQTKYAPTISRITSLQDREGTLLLRDRATGWFAPLRCGRIMTARLIGDVIHLDVELRGTAAVANAATIRENQLKIFNDAVLAAIGTYANTGNYDLLNLVLHESGDIRQLLDTWKEASGTDDVTCWGNVVKMIDDHYPGLDLDFFRIVQLVDSNDNAIALRTDGARRAGLRTAPGREYVLEVLQRTFTGRRGNSSVTSPRHMELLALSDDVKVEQPLRPVLGKYDLLKFPLYISPLAKSGAKNLTLSIVRPSMGQRYGLELALVVRKSRSGYWIRMISVVVFLASLAAYADPSLMASALSPILGLHAQADVPVIEKLAVVLMLLSSNVAGVGTWISSHMQISLRRHQVTDTWMGLCAPLANTGLRMRDNGVCIVSADSIELAISEERLSRQKHDHQLNRSLKLANELTRSRGWKLRGTTISTCSDSARSAKAVGNLGLATVGLSPSHHYSHALAAYVGSSFEDALIVVADAGGNTLEDGDPKHWWAARREQTTVWHGSRTGLTLLELLQSQPFDIGFGEWYRAFTHFLGWSDHMLSGNTMALAGYSTEKLAASTGIWDDDFSGTLGGTIRNNPNDPISLVMRLLEFLGLRGYCDPRSENEEWTEAHSSLAAFVQNSLETAMERLVGRLVSEYGSGKVVITGGVAQNCVMTARIAQAPGVERLFVSGYSGDVGQCVGNALHGRLRDTGELPVGQIESLFLGPVYRLDDARQALAAAGIDTNQGDQDELAINTAERLAAGQIVAVWRGRSEFGPRALGHRSLLCDPTNPEVVRKVKLRVKQRDEFMPLAPVISNDLAAQLTELPLSENMTFAPKLGGSLRPEFGEAMHIDDTARIQVCRNDEWLSNVLRGFVDATGRRVLINTSFNKRGDPIVETAMDAILAAAKLGVDSLVLESRVIDSDTLRAALGER